MKTLCAVLLLSLSAVAADSCLIVKHAGAAHQFLVSGANWQYVAGDFPAGMKWKSNITDGTIRKVKEKGGRVVIVPEKYSMTDLEQAKAECNGSKAKP